MFPWPLCNTGNNDLCSLDSHVNHFLHSEGNIATHAALSVAPQLFQNKQKCLEEQGETWGPRTATCNRFRGQTGRMAVRNRHAAVAFCKSLTVLPAFVSFLCWYMLMEVQWKGKSRSQNDRTPFIPTWQFSARSCVVKDVAVMTWADVVWWKVLRCFKLAQVIYCFLRCFFLLFFLSWLYVSDFYRSG